MPRYCRSVRSGLVLTRLVLAIAASVSLVLGACGEGTDARVGDVRADQARTAALDAGLDDDVADFLALAARGVTATYQATYPGQDGASQILVASRPPDRRVDVLVEGEIVESNLVLDGKSFDCPRDPEEDAIVTCTRTDALVESPGLFTESAIDDLTTALGEWRDDYTFSVETTPIAGVEARCLVTELRDGREQPQLAASGTLCVSPQGVLLRVVQAGEDLEATEYATEVPDNTFVRPDRADSTS